MVKTCNNFVLLKEGDDFYADSAKKNGISLDNVCMWNQGVGSNFESLQLKESNYPFDIASIKTWRSP